MIEEKKIPLLGFNKSYKVTIAKQRNHRGWPPHIIMNYYERQSSSIITRRISGFYNAYSQVSQGRSEIDKVNNL